MVTVKTEDQVQHPSSLAVTCAISIAILALAFSSVFITFLAKAAVSPLAIAFYRMAIATILLAPAALARHRNEIVALSRKELLLILASGFCLAIHFGAWISSLTYISIATSVILVNTHPLFVVVASYFFLGEKPSKSVWLGTAIGFLGMLIISKEGLSNAEFGLKGDLLAILGALAVVGYFIIGRKVRSRVSLLAYVTPLYLVCSTILFIWAQLTDSRLYPYDIQVWLLFLALAIVPTIFGHTVFNWAIKHVRPSTISLAFLGEPVVASVLAFIFFKQTPSIETYAGGALVLAGIYLTMRPT